MVHANAKVERVGGRNPAREARLTVRAGKHRGHTSGMAPGYVQGNLVNGGVKTATWPVFTPPLTAGLRRVPVRGAQAAS